MQVNVVVWLCCPFNAILFDWCYVKALTIALG